MQPKQFRQATKTSKLYLSNKGEFFEVGGKKYTDGIPLGNESVSKGSAHALYNLDGKYEKLTLKVGPLVGKGVDCTINFYADGKLIKSVDIGTEELAKTITVPLNYALQLKIEKTETWGVYGFFDGHFE